MADSDAGVIVASLAVIVALIGILLSNWATRTSNNLLKSELEVKLRPWVYIYDFGPIEIILENGDVLNFSLWKSNKSNYTSPPKEITIALKVKNSGPLPARNYKHFMICRFKKPIKKSDFTHFSPYVRDLVPGEEEVITYSMSFSEYSRQREEPFFIGCSIEYDVNKDLIGQSGMIGWIYDDLVARDNTWTNDCKK